MHRRAKDGTVTEAQTTKVELTPRRVGWVKGERGYELHTLYDLPKTYYRAPDRERSANCPWMSSRSSGPPGKRALDCRCGCQCNSVTGVYPGEENKDDIPTAITLSLEYPHLTDDPNGGVVHKSCGWHPKDEPTKIVWPRGYGIFFARDLPRTPSAPKENRVPQRFSPLDEDNPMPFQGTPTPPESPCVPSNHCDTQRCFDLIRGVCARGGCAEGHCSPTTEQTVRCMIEQYRDAASHGKAHGKHACDDCVIYIRSANWQTSDKPARRGGLRKRTTDAGGKAYRKPSRGARNDRRLPADWMPWNNRNRGNGNKPGSPKGSAAWDEYDPAGNEARDKNWGGSQQETRRIQEAGRRGVVGQRVQGHPQSLPNLLRRLAAARSGQRLYARDDPNSDSSAAES